MCKITSFLLSTSASYCYITWPPYRSTRRRRWRAPRVRRATGNHARNSV